MFFFMRAERGLFFLDGKREGNVRAAESRKANPISVASKEGGVSDDSD